MSVRKVWSQCCLLMCFLPFVCVPAAQAGTSLSGHYYVDFTDYVSGNEEILIDRTYNSHGNQSGLYGNKWGSVFESYVAVSGDGTAVVYENGTGRREVFRSDAVSDGAIHKAINQIIAALKKDHVIKTDTDMQYYTEGMLNDDAFRVAGWKHCVDKGLLPKINTPIGTVFHVMSGSFGGQRLVRTVSGYTRYSQLDTDRFNEQGYIIQHVNAANRSLAENMKYYWSKQGVLFAVSDGAGGNILFVRRNHNNAITALIDNVGKIQAEYRYAKGNLVWSNDADHHIYQYDYDNKNRMSKITDQHGSSKNIEYSKDGKVIREY